jgi:hypothetical protein
MITHRIWITLESHDSDTDEYTNELEVDVATTDDPHEAYRILDELVFQATLIDRPAERSQ